MRSPVTPFMEDLLTLRIVWASREHFWWRKDPMSGLPPTWHQGPQHRGLPRRVTAPSPVPYPHDRNTFGSFGCLLLCKDLEAGTSAQREGLP